MPESSRVVVLPTPEKSKIDKKTYRVIKLENGLTAMLISDMESLQGEPSRRQIEDDEEESDDDDYSDDDEDMEDESSNEDDSNEGEASEREEYLPAAAIRIGAGSLEDPKEIGGLMHFLEHMLFMGSGKYPKESFFEAFIQKHGGTDNGFTELERKTFYFDIQEQHLKKGLDVFSQFFIDPLIRINAIGREKKAVNSEFQLAVPNDIVRLERFFGLLANEDHPMSNFFWGNDQTLDVDISDQELQSVLFNLWKKYYSSEHMTLAVQARESLDTLQEWVVEIFSKIPNYNLPLPTYDHLPFPWKMEKWNKFYGIVPVKELTKVVISWALPSLLTKYRSKPAKYVATLLDNEGVGSILSSLMKRNLAISIRAGDMDDNSEHNSIFCMFHIDIDLTDEGFEKMDTVLHTVFQYLNLIRSVPPVKWIFEENRKIDDMDFNFGPEDNAYDNVVQMVDNMMLFPPEHYINGADITFDFEPEEIVKVLKCLVPEKCNIIAMSKNYDNNEMATETEKWFGIKYFSKDIPTQWQQLWKKSPLSSDLSFPPPNPYVTSDFALLSRETKSPEYPSKIKCSDVGELWYKQDQKFGLPTVSCNISWINENWCNSARTFVAINLYIRLFHHIYSEFLDPMTAALYEHSFRQNNGSLELKVYGFSQHFTKILRYLRTSMASLTSNLDEATFNLEKEELIKDYHNNLIEPDVMNRDIRLSILLDTHWTIPQRLLALKDLDMTSFISVISNSIDIHYTKVLVQGNFSTTEAEKIFDIVVSENAASKDRLFKIKTRQLQIGSYTTRVMAVDQSNSNGSVTNYYQHGPASMWTEALNQFIMHIMSEQAFDFLRTKETLGYSVSCGSRYTNGVLGIDITVNYHSNKHSVDLVDSKIEEFLIHFQGYLENLSDFEFREFVNSFKKDKRVADIALHEEVSRNWEEIASGEYVFDRLKKHYDLTSQITKEVTLAFFSEISSVTSAKYRKLSIQIEGPQRTEGSKCPEYKATIQLPIEDILKCRDPGECNRLPTKFITDLQEYRKSLDYYPVFKML